MESETLKAALAYQALGLSVIPVRSGGKEPLIKWAEFQTRIASEDEIRAWWTKWPTANVGIVTGRISNIVVVDVDTQAGYLAIEDYIPSSIECPTVHTPRGGAHLYFQYEEGLGNDARTIDGCDLRGEGGFVVAPPSFQGSYDNQYRWEPGTYIKECTPPALPQVYVSLLRKGIGTDRNKNRNKQEQKEQQEQTGTNRNKQEQIGTMPNSPSDPSTSYRLDTSVAYDASVARDAQNVDNSGDPAILSLFNNNTSCILKEGNRDIRLYDMAYKMIRAGIPPDEVQEHVLRVAAACDPPFPPAEAIKKIESAIAQALKRGTMPQTEETLSDKIRDYILAEEGLITPPSVARMFQEHNMNSGEKLKIYNLVKQILRRMAEKGQVIKTGSGYQAHGDEDIEKLDILHAESKVVTIAYPLGLEYWVRTFPRSIVALAGTSNSGKTAWSMDFAHMNLDKYAGNAIYVTSEMSPSQMAYRLSNWRSLEDWANKMEFVFGNKKYWRFIKPDGLTIIDFLEIYDNFYALGQEIQEIHNLLKGGICVINLQKKAGARYGRGAEFGLEKPQIYLSMERNKIIIEKAKTWATGKNPNGMECGFNLIGGWKFQKEFDWRDPDDKPVSRSRGTYNPE